MQHLLRRKIVPIIIVFILLPVIVQAQLRNSLNLPEHDAKLYHFGINLGFNSSHFSFTHHPNFLQQDSVMGIESLNSTGINLGWLVNININDHFDIRTYPLDLTFTEKAFQYSLNYPDVPGGEEMQTMKKVQSITLSLPIQLKFSSDRIDNFKVYTIGGVKFDYDLASNAGKINSGDLIKLNKFDYGVEAGIGFHFYFPFFVLTPELKASWGLSNLHSRNSLLKFSSNIDKINSRMVSFSITVE